MFHYLDNNNFCNTSVLAFHKLLICTAQKTKLSERYVPIRYTTHHRTPSLGLVHGNTLRRLGYTPKDASLDMHHVGTYLTKTFSNPC